MNEDKLNSVIPHKCLCVRDYTLWLIEERQPTVMVILDA